MVGLGIRMSIYNGITFLMTQFQALSDSEKLNAGRELRQMMDSDSFNYAVQILLTKYSNAFFVSDPSDTVGREQAYKSNAALSDLLGTMRVIIEISDGIEKQKLHEEQYDY